MKVYTATVKMDEPLKASKSLDNVSLVINDGWATFTGKAESPFEFEFLLLDSIDGMPADIKAVESW
jgi:hypothetical protein